MPSAITIVQTKPLTAGPSPVYMEITSAGTMNATSRIRSQA